MALVSAKSLEGQFPYYFVAVTAPLRHGHELSLWWLKQNADNSVETTAIYRERTRFSQAKVAEAAARGLVDTHRGYDIVLLFVTALGAVSIHSTLHKAQVIGAHA